MYANQGYTPREIARKIKVPEGLQRQWYIRPYYGSLEVNSRAVFQNYLGYYDGNPVHLVELSDVEDARKFVEYAGSEEAVLEKARKDFENGEYQYAAVASNKVVFVNPQNTEARYLCADALEQLGYQAESSVLRNAYLMGALELRKSPRTGRDKDSGAREVSRIRNLDTLNGMNTKLLLDYLGIVIDADRAEKENLAFELLITAEDDTEKVLERYYVNLYCGVLLYHENYRPEGEVSVVRATKSGLIDIIMKDYHPSGGKVRTEDHVIVEKLSDYVSDLSASADFSIIEP